MSKRLHNAPSPQGMDRLAQWQAGSAMAQWMGFQAELGPDGLTYQLQFTEEHVGNSLSGTLHGGVVSAFLQSCGMAETHSRIDADTQAKLVSIHCNYLRPARRLDLFGRAEVLQSGQRLAFLDVSCWQADETKVVAKASVAVRLL